MRFRGLDSFEVDYDDPERAPRARPWILLALLSLLGIVSLPALWLARPHAVADGLVSNRRVVVRSPADVRVVDVLCEPGQRIQRGDPLLRLESLARQETRRELSFALEQHRRSLRELEGAQDSSARSPLDRDHRSDRARSAPGVEHVLAELSRVERALEDLDRAEGDVVLRAEEDGVVDDVHVERGAPAAVTDPLVSYHDPDDLWVVVYATPSQARQFARGRVCRVVAEGAEEPLSGRVAAVGEAWVDCPTELPLRRASTTDLRLPVRIECDSLEALAGLGQQRLVRVRTLGAVGRDAGPTEAAADPAEGDSGAESPTGHPPAP